MPILPIILPIKNFLQTQDYRKLIKVLFRTWIRYSIRIFKWQIDILVKFTKSCYRWVVDNIRFSRSPLSLIFSAFVAVVLFVIVLVGLPVLLSSLIRYILADWILPVVLAPFLALAFIFTSILSGLDKLFYLGFNIHIVIGWAFWGLVIGLAIQGYRAMKIYDQKRMKIWVVVAPVLLLCVIGTIRYVSYVIASNPPSPETGVIAAQGTAGLDTETITDTAPAQGFTTPAATEADEKSKSAPVLRQQETAPPTPQTEPAPVIPKQVIQTTPTPARDPAPTTPAATEADEKSESAPATKQQETLPPPPTKPSEPTFVTPKQETATIPTPVPKPVTPLVPSDMILIPAGDFQMGSNNNTDEKPVHTVYIDAFYIDKYEVTNAQYKAFVDTNPQWRKDRIPSAYHNGNYLKHWNGNNHPSEKGNHPVAYVSWYGAMAYAQWTGKRLPTEAEWEKAARGGKSGLQYPWGNTISNGQANYGNHVGDTTVVGNYAANGYGLYDMAGNVLEWCLDAYYSDFYFSSPHRNPLGGVNTIENADLVISDFVKVTTTRVARGGAWYNTEVQNVRVAYRNRVPPTLTNIALGFRCVKVVR